MKTQEEVQRAHDVLLKEYAYCLQYGDDYIDASIACSTLIPLCWALGHDERECIHQAGLSPDIVVEFISLDEHINFCEEKFTMVPLTIGQEVH